jgi:stress response protein YsnF
VPAGRFIDAVPEIRHEGDVTIIPVVEEVAVVETRLWLREEVHVTRRRVTVEMPQTVTLRREELRVESLSADTAQQAVDAEERHE